jgi:hypothetical protein
MYREENASFYCSYFFCLCIAAGMCFNKPVTKAVPFLQVPYLLLREDYIRNMPLRAYHN